MLTHLTLPHLSLLDAAKDSVALHPLALVGLCGVLSNAFNCMPVGEDTPTSHTHDHREAGPECSVIMVCRSSGRRSCLHVCLWEEYGPAGRSHGPHRTGTTTSPDHH
jgi:hypothetical protein